MMGDKTLQTAMNCLDQRSERRFQSMARRNIKIKPGFADRNHSQVELYHLTIIILEQEFYLLNA